MEPNLIDGSLEPPKKNLILRLFSGDVSLPITYWVFGVLIYGILTSIITTVLDSNYAAIAIKPGGLFFLQGVYLLVIVYTIFIWIAIWRSAGKFQGSSFWAGAARVMVVLGALSVIGAFASGLKQRLDDDYDLSEEEVRRLNESLPTMVDEITRLDSISFVDKNFYYHNTLVSDLVVEIDVENFSRIMKDNISNSLCTTTRTRSALDAGISFIYSYKDMAGMDVTKIVITKSNCQ